MASMLARRFRSRAVVELENLALRHQLHVLRTVAAGSAPTVRDRPPALGPALPTVAALSGGVVLVKPATVIQWHRQGFRLYWRWRSRSGRPSMDRNIRDMIRQMSSANPLSGAPRIHGELLKLGIEVSQATVAKYMVRKQRAPSSTCSFLQNHAEGIVLSTRSLWRPRHFGCSTS